MLIRTCMKNFPGEQHLLSGDNSNSKELSGKRIRSVSHEQGDSGVHICKEKCSVGLTNMVLGAHCRCYYALQWNSLVLHVASGTGRHDPGFPRSRSDPPNWWQCSWYRPALTPLINSSVHSHDSGFMYLLLKLGTGCSSYSSDSCWSPKGLGCPDGAFPLWEPSCNVTGLCPSGYTHQRSTAETLG